MNGKRGEAEAITSGSSASALVGTQAARSCSSHVPRHPAKFRGEHIAIIACYCRDSDHVRAGVEQPVTHWHITAMREARFGFARAPRIHAPGNPYGENRSIRVDVEWMLLFQRPR